MRDNGFPMPKGSSFRNFDNALSFFKSLDASVMIKPIDSSGSKGVFLCHTEEDLRKNWESSLYYSIEKEIIVEEFIQKKGYQIDGDIFVINGKIVFWGICDQHHDMELAPYVPIGLSYPSIQEQSIQDEARKQIQQILTGLNMTMGAYNVEYIVDQNDQVYILEIGPRNGGNYIPNVIKTATGYDMATLTVRQAVGDDCSQLLEWELKNPVSSYNIHSQKDGMLGDIIYSGKLNGHIIETLMYEEKGAKVSRFKNAADSLGIMLLSFSTQEELCRIVDNMNDYINVCIE